MGCNYHIFCRAPDGTRLGRLIPGVQVDFLGSAAWAAWVVEVQRRVVEHTGCEPRDLDWLFNQVGGIRAWAV